MVTNATVPQDLSSNINQGSLCGESLHAYKAKLEECNERVKTETCVEEIIDFYHCVDHCAAIEILRQNSQILFRLNLWILSSYLL